MGKRTYTYDGSNWVGLASPSVDVSNYANMATTQISGFRNAIINGGMDIWQRGTSITPTNGGYNADRWLTWLDGSGSTRLITQQSFTPGAGEISGYEPKYFLRYNQSVAGSGATYNYLLQKIEDVRTFAGQNIVISFWAKTSANTTIPGILIGQAYGSGGSPSSFQYTTVATSVAVTTSWTKFTYTISVPSLSGKTLGTNLDSSLHVFFSLPINATFTFDVWGVQVEPGTIATPFEQRPIGIEISLCQRYFCSSFPIGTAPTTPALTGSSGGNDLTNYSPTVGNSYSTFKPFPVPMRSSPTLTIYNSEITAIGSWSFYNSSSKNGDFAITSASSNSRGFLIYQAGTHTVSNGGWAASAEL